MHNKVNDFDALQQDHFLLVRTSEKNVFFVQAVVILGIRSLLSRQ
jgi:hypothetical protein